MTTANQTLRQEQRYVRKAAIIIALVFVGIVSHSTPLFAATPVPIINRPLVPDAAVPGGAAFTLTVNGTGFVSGSTVYWNGSPRTTAFVSGSQLTAAIDAVDIAVAATASVTVVNPAPGGGRSNPAFFSVTTSTRSILLAETDYLTGSRSQAVAAADLNGDGKVDLAVGNLDSATVSVFLGNGDGTFKTRVDFATGMFPNSVAVGDFNGDGKPDLALANGSGTVSILLGNGDGTFQPHVDYLAGPAAFSVAVGDFNGDGKLDLAVANNNSNQSGTVSILLGNGDGTFQPHVDYPVGMGPYSVAIGDFNKDGKLDLVVANYPSVFTVSVLLGNGDGTFQPQVTYPVGRQPISVAVADLNGDGNLDLAVADFTDGFVSVLLGNGDGTFRPSVEYPTGRVPSTIIIGDFNGDGKLDVATSNFAPGGYTVPPGYINILFGNGDGTFQAPVAFVAGPNPDTVVAADLNNDGALDFITGSGSVAGAATFSVLLQVPQVSLSSGSLTFPSQVVGTTSASQTVGLTNNQTTALSITSVTFSGTNASDFAETDNCIGSVAAGASCTINVTFTPAALGSRTGTLNIAANNISGNPLTVQLTGTGVTTTQIANLSTNSLTFTAQIVGSTSPAQGITLTNAGNSTLTISSLAFSGTNASDFTETDNCIGSIAAGASCTINVTFSPTATGTRTGTLSITDNATSPQSPQTVALTGTATAPSVSVTPSSIAFPTQYVGTSGLPQSVTVTNNGNAPLSITSVTTSATDFGTLNACGSTVAAGSSCAIGVFFDPTASGTRAGTLTINDNGPGSPQTVALSGTGQDFSIASPVPTATVAAGQTATYSVSLSPGGGFSQTVSLSCTGAPSLSTCNVSPSSVTLNGTSATSVTVTVSTTAPAIIFPLEYPRIGSPRTVNFRQVFPLMVLLALALMASLGKQRREREQPVATMFLVILLFCAGMTLAACGGGNASVTPKPGTQPGSYSLTVSGTFTSGSTTLAHSTKLTLVVQ